MSNTDRMQPYITALGLIVVFAIVIASGFIREHNEKNNPRTPSTVTQFEDGGLGIRGINSGPAIGGTPFTMY